MLGGATVGGWVVHVLGTAGHSHWIPLERHSGRMTTLREGNSEQSRMKTKLTTAVGASPVCVCVCVCTCVCKCVCAHVSLCIKM